MRIFSALILLALASLMFKTCEALDLKAVELGKVATQAQLHWLKVPGAKPTNDGKL